MDLHITFFSAKNIKEKREFRKKYFLLPKKTNNKKNREREDCIQMLPFSSP